MSQTVRGVEEAGRGVLVVDDVHAALDHLDAHHDRKSNAWRAWFVRGSCGCEWWAAVRDCERMWYWARCGWRTDEEAEEDEEDDHDGQDDEQSLTAVLAVHVAIATAPAAPARAAIRRVVVRLPFIHSFLVSSQGFMRWSRVACRVCRACRVVSCRVCAYSAVAAQVGNEAPVEVTVAVACRPHGQHKKQRRPAGPSVVVVWGSLP